MDFLNSPLFYAIESFLLRDFPPAITVEDADICMTTIEAYERIQETYPGGYTLADFNDILVKNYNSVPVGELKSVWVFKRKHNA